jgi:hypothetical protein
LSVSSEIIVNTAGLELIGARCGSRYGGKITQRAPGRRR